MTSSTPTRPLGRFFLPRRNSRRGATSVELTLCAFLLLMVIFGIVDICRMALVYTTISNSARAGARYAIVHGCDRTGVGGVDGPSGLGNVTQVQTVVKNFGSAGLLDPTKLSITVDYPDSTSQNCSNNTAGSHVTVAVTYPFSPLIGYFPLSVTLGNTSQGIITF